jgi:alpha-D-xyloside xylohydrolase
VTGPRWVRERHGFLSVPLLVRPGAVIPVGAVDDRPDYVYADGVTLRAYGLERGAQVTVPVGGVTFTVVREGNTLRASSSDPAAPWGLAAGRREVRAKAGTGFLSLDLEPELELESE